MEHLQLSYKNSQISYYPLWFRAQDWLFAFMVMGKRQPLLLFWKNMLVINLPSIAIDLPFHGQTEWNDGLNFTISDLLQIIEEILSRIIGT